MQRYYSAVDDGRLDEAVGMLAEDVEFAMILPTGENRNSGRANMHAYLSGRPPVDRRHVPERCAVDRDIEFTQGRVTEGDDDVTTGYFVGVMHIADDGLIDRYQVTFSPDFAVHPDREDS
ncbi:nuclear transport factor 2 family protein [Gordonia sp. HY442]|nr:nuclear transport factor 2 family protein [Gordonia zhenghanii]MCF8605896.1 nuclear transport factor 2 family protein [Gordonia zhenghanii]